MNELDENGWGHIHYAAFRGFVKSIERFVKASEDQLELETGDDLHSTPLLLATMSGNLDSVKLLIDLGAKVNVINSQNHGVVELSCFKQFVEVLEYFIGLDHPSLPVWKNLIKFFASDSDEESEAAGKCLRRLTQGSSEGMNPNWEHVYNNGGVPTIVKVIKGSIGDEAKIQAFHVLMNLIGKDEVKEQAVGAGCLAAMIRHLKGSNNFLIQLAAQGLKEICVVKSYAEQAAQNGAIPALIKVVQTVHDPEVLVEVVSALGNISEASPTHQGTTGTTPGAVTSIVGLFEDCTNKSLLMALTQAVAKIVHGHKGNQTAFVNEGVSSNIIMLTRVKNKDLQLAAVEAVHKLAENNSDTQKAILEEGVVMPLMQLLKKSRLPSIQEKTAGALWALAGSDTEERRTMASMIGVQLLIEFLSSLSEDLHYIGSEGLGVLAQGPHNKQTAIGHANGVHPLVRLLRSDKEYIVLSVIRTLRHLCVGVGYVPHTGNQGTVAHSRGNKFLVALMVHSKNEMIQVEAALTLGCVTLGNAENLEEIQQNMDFSYIRILKMMYVQNEQVRLLAGAALAAFAYNNVAQQKEIAEQGGVRFSCFVSFLESEEEYFRCNAAFQVVVLARIIPDEEQALSSAAGIKLLIDLLQDSKSDEILALAADCIARLAHTRAGVPGAMVSIEAVDLLCNLMLSPVEQVRGNAAIALGYLSYHHQAERQLLNRCRQDPYMMKILTYYTKNSKLSGAFLDGWKHYKKVGLPPIEEGRPSLVAKKHVYKDIGGRPLTITSLGEGGSSNPQSSPTVLNSAFHDDGQGTIVTERSSRASRASIQSGTGQPSDAPSSDRSHHSRNSIMSNVMSPEITAGDEG